MDVGTKSTIVLMRRCSTTSSRLSSFFGERQAIQKNVSERVALITFSENARSFEQQRDWIDRIYELRSRYVHDGTEITDELQLDQLRSLCEQVFRCLMRLQAVHSQRSSRGKEALTTWLHELDYLAKGMIAGNQPTATQFSETLFLVMPILRLPMQLGPEANPRLP